MARWMCVLGVLGAALLLRAEPPAGFDAVVRPFLESYCVSCHAGKRAKGDLDLARAGPADASVWAAVRVRLGRRDMPPEDADRPSEEEYRGVTAWLDARRGADEPGRVTIRRLNRTEYENTVRDLLGVAFDTGATFPADDVGYGFDNIGDVLSLPPILMEKYLAAAEAIAFRAVVDESAGPAVRRFEADRLHMGGYGRASAQGAVLYASGEIFLDVRLPRDGVYVLRARAFGDQAGPAPAQLTFRADGRNLSTVDVPAERGAPRTYEHRVRLKEGARRIGFGFYNDYYRPNDPDPRNRDRNLGVAWAEVEGPTDAPRSPPSHRRLVPKDPPETGWEPLLKETVARLAERAWRRPVAGDEVDRVLLAAAKAAPGASFAGRLRVAVTTLLVSPHFLFRVEPDPGPGVRDLTGWELASRLSYFLWASMPDDRLFDLARRGELRPRLDDEVARMLKDPRASTLAHRFAAQWLQIGRLDEIEPDPTRFPEVDAALKEAMRRETELFFEAVLREDRSVWQLIDADFTFVNGPLAKLYGIAGVEGPFLRRVAVDGQQRGGVLAHASVLLSTSNPTRTSPVKRGKWILEALLDAPLPPPPPGADQFDESPEALLSASLRERLERHRTDPQCATCHLVMDTLGFGLENYDAVGRWRERDRGRFAVDSSGELPDGRTFSGPPGLRRILHGDRRFLRSLAKHMLVYALGRGATAADEPAFDRLADTLKDDPRLSTLVREIVSLDAFTKRRGEERTK